MRRILTVLTFVAAIIVGTAGVAHAGSAHFVDDHLSVARDGDSLTATGKIGRASCRERVWIPV